MSSPKFLYSDTRREPLILTPMDGPFGSATTQDVHGTKESSFIAEPAQSGGETEHDDPAWKARNIPRAIHVRIQACVYACSDVQQPYL